MSEHITLEEAEKIDWKARFFALKEAVELMSETAIYSAREATQIPTYEAWSFVEECASHYSSDKPVKKLAIPSAVLSQQQGEEAE